MEVNMSIQKHLSKGFTLIELMVVIVIIGILAAVAIPKLFGMSAKAKAQEVGPAVGTWSKLQMAYKMETGNLGDAFSISFKVPGGTTTDATEGVTSNFTYSIPKATTNAGATFSAANNFNSDPCKAGNKWQANFDSKSDVPALTIAGDDAKGCFTLTPNYLKIGCVTAKSDDMDPTAIVCAK
jgi:prepilin-type N-terminal cleavage/methylation domain-containing protein